MTMACTRTEPEPVSKTRRFAILCTDGRLRGWQAQCVRQLVDSGAGTPVVVAIRPCGTFQSTEHQAEQSARGSHRARRRLRNSRALASVDTISLLPELPRLTAAGGTPIRTRAIADELRARDLDFVLCFAEGPVPRALASTARWGVWCYRHGVEQHCTDSESCARSLLSGGHLTEVNLVRIGATAIDDTLLYRGCFGTRAMAGANLERVLLGSTEWCVSACRGLSCDGSVALSPALHPTEAVAAPCETADRAAAGPAWPRRVASRLWRALFLLETWNVAVVDTPVTDVVRTGRTDGARWLPAPARFTFRADPFAVVRDGEYQLLFEAYDYRTCKGTIAGGRFDPESATVQTSLAMSGPEHMSYPFLIEEDGELFCIPETSEAKAAVLMRMTGFPATWQKAATLIDGSAVVDGTVFRHDGRWWLLGTDDATGPNEKLNAWYADRLHGPWTAHPLNPIKCDIRSSRPAGRPFMIDGALYRPAQDCSNGYGGAVAIHRILTLTPTAFDEVLVARVAPDRDGPYPDGLHTLCPIDGRVLIDGMRRTFFPLAGIVKLIESRASARRKARSARRPLAVSQRSTASHPTAAAAVPRGAAAHRNTMRSSG